jgi:uncharacterized protein YcbK (DUF882 family)
VAVARSTERWRLLVLVLVQTLLLGLLLSAGWAPSVAQAQRYHTVRQGQSLSKIAKRYRVHVWDLALANDLTPKSKLSIGKSLMVPPRGVTYVRPGQTLSHIARAHKVSVKELMRLNRIRKQGRVRVGQRIALPGFLSEKARDRDWGEPDNPGHVKLRRRDAQQTLELDDGQGRVRLKGLRELARLMRRHEDDDVQSVHPRLALLLARISDHFGGREIVLVSGFREAGGYTRESSRHLAGRAADIQVRGVPRRLVWEFCKSLAQTGCGFYPRSVFVHVDVRERHGQWVDWSGPGKRPRYGTLRGPYRRRQRRDPNRPRETRRVTRAELIPLVVEVVDRRNQVVNTFDERRATEADEHEEGAEDDLGDDEIADDATVEEQKVESIDDAPES